MRFFLFPSRRGNEEGEESRCKSKLPFFLEIFNLKNGMVGKCEVFFSCIGGVLHSRCDLC